MIKYVIVRIGITFNIEDEENNTEASVKDIVNEMTYGFQDTTGKAKVLDTEMIEIEDGFNDS